MLGRAKFASFLGSNLISSRRVHNSVSALEMLGALGAGIGISMLSLHAQIWIEDRSKTRVQIDRKILDTQFNRQQISRPTHLPSHAQLEVIRLCSLNILSFLAQELYQDAIHCLKAIHIADDKLKIAIDLKTAKNAPIELLIMLMKMCDPAYTDNIRVLQVLEQRTLMAFKLNEPNRKICEDFIDSARRGWEITQR